MKIILTIIMMVFTGCSPFDSQKSIPISNSETAIPSNKVSEDKSIRSANEKRMLEDFLRFKKLWNAKDLKSFKEQSIENPNQKADETYRFFWIPSFENSVAIRAWRDGDKQFLVVKKVGGHGFTMKNLSYEKSRSLTAAEWSGLVNLLEQTSFWTMPTIDIDMDPVVDGAFYRLEGNKNKQFHEVQRATGSKNESEIRQVGAYLLSLTELKTGFSEY